MNLIQACQSLIHISLWKTENLQSIKACPAAPHQRPETYITMFAADSAQIKIALHIPLYRSSWRYITCTITDMKDRKTVYIIPSIRLFRTWQECCIHQPALICYRTSPVSPAQGWLDSLCGVSTSSNCIRRRFHMIQTLLEQAKYFGNQVAITISPLRLEPYLINLSTTDGLT